MIENVTYGPKDILKIDYKIKEERKPLLLFHSLNMQMNHVKSNVVEKILKYLDWHHREKYMKKWHYFLNEQKCRSFYSKFNPTFS